MHTIRQQGSMFNQLTKIVLTYCDEELIIITTEVITGNFN